MAQDTRARTYVTVAKYGVVVLLMAALSALQVPYQYGNGNQVFQIPKVHQLMNPDLYPDDALVHSLRNYPSAVYPAIAWITVTLGGELESVYLVLWALQRLILVGLVVLIASRFVDDFSGRCFVALVACTAQWAVRRTPIGGEHLFAAHMTHTELAFVLQMGALAAWLHRREVLAGALIGAAVHLNAMTTVHAAGFLALLWLLRDNRFSMRYLWAAGAMVLVAAPFTASLYDAMAGTAGAAGTTDRFWELLRIRGGPHYFLNALDFGALASVAVVMWLLWRVRRPHPALHRMMLAGVIYVATMFVVALVGVEIASSKLAVLFHPLRGDKMLFLTFALAVPIIVWKRAGQRAGSGAGRVLLPAICAAFMMGYTPPHVALTVLPALLALLAIAGDRPTLCGLDTRYVVTGAVVLLGAGLLVVPTATLYGAALLAGVVAGAIVGMGADARVVLPGLVALVALALMARATGLSGGQFEWYRAGQDRQFVEVAEWADEETSPDARFITPTWMEGWRCLSRRSTLAQYRDLSAMHWDVGFEGPLWERLEALNGAVLFGDDLAERLRAGYLALRPAELAVTADRYDIDYVVMPVQWSHDEEIEATYGNESYQVFAISALNRVFDEADDADEMEADRDGR